MFLANTDKRQSQIIGIILPGFGHWTQGKWPLWLSLSVLIFALLVGAFTYGVGYLVVGLIDAATL